MMAMKNHDLKKAIRRKLLIRLGLTSLAVSAVLALGVYVRERDRVSGEVVERARQSVKRFNVQILPLLDAPAPLDAVDLQRELEEFRKGTVRLSQGEFVLVSIYDGSGRAVMREVDPEFVDAGPVNDYMDGVIHDGAERRTEWHVIKRIAGAPFIHVSEPLDNTGGEAVAHIEGVFAVSDDEIAAVDRRMMRTALAGIAIVLLTAALMYPFITSLLGRLTRLTVELLDANMETLQVLGSAIAKRDSDTDAHNFRVSVYSVKIAEAIGLDNEGTRTLIKGAFLHDVGKIGVRDAVLLKPGPLSDEEYEVMKRHVDHGLDIVERSDWLVDAGSVVGSHHEKYDGTGYHRGLSGEEIPITARIFALADVFDALTSERPYKKPYTYDDSMQVLAAGRGTHFDPYLLDKFSEISRELYEEFAHADIAKPRAELESIVRRYFQMEVGDLV